MKIKCLILTALILAISSIVFAQSSKSIQKPEEALVNSGLDAYTNNNFDKAIADYSKYIEIKPQDGNAFDQRGYAYTNKKDYDRAIADFGKAIQIYQDRSSPSYVLRGNAYLGKKDLERKIMTRRLPITRNLFKLSLHLPSIIFIADWLTLKRKIMPRR